MATKKPDLIFNCINLSKLRDETIYKKLKDDAQREYILAVFLYNIVCLYLNWYWKRNHCGDKYKDSFNEEFLIRRSVNKSNIKFFNKEMTEFKTFMELDINKDRIKYLVEKTNINEILCEYRGYTFIHQVYQIFNLYDDSFNSRIILQKLCGIDELSIAQFHSIILYFFDKIQYLQNMFEPAYNTRSIIIKNYYPAQDPGQDIREDKLPLKNSTGIDYTLEYESGVIYYIFDEKFKEDIRENNFSDGYDFYWKSSSQDPDDYLQRKDTSKCLKYLVEILNPDGEQIMSMTVTRIPSIPKKQIHFYIKRNLATQIKSLMKEQTSYKNISLVIHSFAAWLFEADFIYSNLMKSMKEIFEKNGITVEDIDETDDISRTGPFCIRRLANRITITEEFRDLWLWKDKSEPTEVSPNEFIRMYKLVKPVSASEKKYLKYKTKYMNLKNLLLNKTTIG